MKTSVIDREQLKTQYGILCQALIPAQNTERDAFNLVHCEVPADGRTQSHAHFEPEVFVLLRGQGSLKLGDRVQAVEAGSVVSIPAFVEHQLENGGKDPLVFLSIYSEHASLAPLPAKANLIAAPPTPNGPLHLGHLAGPYLGADVLRRYLTLRGTQVYSLCGTDDHQPYNCCEDFVIKIKNALACTQIEFQNFVRPSKDTAYQTAVQKVVNSLLQSDKLHIRDCPTAHLSNGEPVLESHIRGTCPTCNVSMSAMACEACGEVPLHRLVDPVHVATGESIEFHSIPRLMISLERHRAAITSLLTSGSASASVLQFLRRTLSRPLPDYPVSTLSPLGIPIPQTKGQHLDVWTEMAASYVALLPPDAPFMPFFGFDNVFFYTVLFPALFEACGRSDLIPAKVYANEFYHLEHRKFSTSRQHAVWANDLLAHVDSDCVRFFLALDRPEQNSTSFSIQRFEEALNEHLLRLETVTGKLNTTPEGPHHARAPHKAQQQYLQELASQIQDMESALHPDHFSVRKAAAIVVRAIDALEVFTLSYPDERQMALAGVCTLAQLCMPLLPSYSQHLFERLGISPQWFREPKTSGFHLGQLADGRFQRSSACMRHYQIGDMQ